MFKKQDKTVASVLAQFQTIADDLQKIITDQEEVIANNEIARLEAEGNIAAAQVEQERAQSAITNIINLIK